MLTIENQKIWTHTLVSALFLGGMCYFFIAVFQPFGTYNFSPTNKYLLLLPYGGLGFFSFLCWDLLLPHKPNQWSAKREIKLGFAVLLSCSIGSYWYNSQILYSHSISFFGWLEMFFYTLLIGLPILVLHSLIQYAWYSERVKREIPNKVDLPRLEEDVISIKTDLVQEVYQLKMEDFICAQSEGNYCTVYYVVEGMVKRQLMRLPLKKLKDQLPWATIQYCHRSYLVNIDFAIEIRGNAQGGKMYLNYMNQPIPVSRTYFQGVKEQVNCDRNS